MGWQSRPSDSFFVGLNLCSATTLYYSHEVRMSSGDDDDDDDDVITYNDTNISFGDDDEEEVVILQQGPALTLKMLKGEKVFYSAW